MFYRKTYRVNNMSLRTDSVTYSFHLAGETRFLADLRAKSSFWSLVNMDLLTVTN